MIERRHFPRLKIKLPVKIKVFDKETNGNITNSIDAFTEDVSRGGMRLMLPRSWACAECNNCLGWIYNLGCSLKNNHTNDSDRFLTNKLNLKISISDPNIPTKEAVDLEGSCVWVKTDTKPKEENYPVGISVNEASQKKISAYFSSLLAP